MLRRYFIQGAPQRLFGVCPCSVTACYEQFNPHAVWVSGGRTGGRARWRRCRLEGAFMPKRWWQNGCLCARPR